VKLDALDRLCRQSIVHPVDEQVSISAAEMWAELKKKGRRPSDVDVLIAATAFVNGCAVACADRDFENLRGFVEVENWLSE
jgi:tRNA(fMet)-specific endonuclease VapC